MSETPKIALACTGHRGVRCLQRIRDIAPDAEVVVFSHPPEEWEPDYYDELMGEADRLGAEFVTKRRLLTLNGADLLICVGWRYLVPPEVYETARLGAWVFHDSLLPASRGFSPTVWAVRSGERTPGATLFRMTEEVDAGPIVGQGMIEDEFEPMASVVAQVTDVYLWLLDQYLPELMAGTASVIEQDHDLATFCPKWGPDDLRIDWSWGADEIVNHVRAFGYPYPWARTMADGIEVKVLRAVHPAHTRVDGGFPGQVLRFSDEGVEVICGDSGTVLITDANPMALLRRLSLRLR